MRAQAVRRGAEPRSAAAAAPAVAGRPSAAALVFLRGRDADGRLRELVAARAQAGPVLGALAAALLDPRGFEALETLSGIQVGGGTLELRQSSGSTQR